MFVTESIFKLTAIRHIILKFPKTYTINLSMPKFPFQTILLINMQFQLMFYLIYYSLICTPYRVRVSSNDHFHSFRFNVSFSQLLALIIFLASITMQWTVFQMSIFFLVSFFPRLDTSLYNENLILLPNFCLKTPIPLTSRNT